MHKNNFYISFGVWLLVIPFLGIPINWVRILIFLSGLFLVSSFLGPTILKKLQPKLKKKQNTYDSQKISPQLNEDDKLRFSAPVENESQVEIDKHEN